MTDEVEQPVQERTLVTVTPAAALQLRSVLNAQQRDGAAVRVYIAGRGSSGFQFGLALADEPDADDLLVETAGVRLVVDLVSAPLLNGARIDYIDGGSQRGFAVLVAGSGSNGGCGGGAGGCSCGRGGCGRR
jgi:iron-sulfur cluster assembly accessory protein